MMFYTKVENDFRITIPEELRRSLEVGQELLVTIDKNGRLILIPESQIEAILQRTAGMWQGRKDIPADGVEYVNQLRQGDRLSDLGIEKNGH
jgi:bifunctional DNA-binding transcriptional regulator/antitoxin component of YhaV-PrlF toxin-antitoxin module